jgi:integrase
MPNWTGKWKGGRYYVDEDGRKVFFIERRVEGRQRGIRLSTHDEKIAEGMLGLFEQDPIGFSAPPPPKPDESAVYITPDRIKLYLQSIRKAVQDHRNARQSYLKAWANYRDDNGRALDLRKADRHALRAALASFDGGYKGRAEALNAFARFMCKESELAQWNPLVNTTDPEATRADRVAYSVEEMRETWERLPAGAIRDVFLVRLTTGLHGTEIAQIKGAPLYSGPLPDKGVGIRVLDGKHEIRGVVQVVHKKKHKKERRHRVSMNQATLEAVLRLQKHVPTRVSVWEALDPIVPSNLRHTFITLGADVGELVTFTGGGVDRSRVAQVVGHRSGSTMTADRYEKQQIPPMIKLPLGFPKAVQLPKDVANNQRAEEA